MSAPTAFGRPVHVVSWDAGPILMVPDLMGTPNTVTPVDVRDYSMGPAQPINTPPGTPTIAIPGEPVRWFTDGTPQQVITNGPTPDALLVPPLPNGPGHVSEPLSQAFQQNLRTDDEIVDATIMYGGHSAALAAATAGLTDIEMRAVVGVAPKFAASGAQMLAMLYLLSGLRFDAYHPAGTYGIAAMTAEQLSAAGWTSAPELILGDTDQLGWLLCYSGNVSHLARRHRVAAGGTAVGSGCRRSQRYRGGAAGTLSARLRGGRPRRGGRDGRRGDRRAAAGGDRRCADGSPAGGVDGPGGRNDFGLSAIR